MNVSSRDRGPDAGQVRTGEASDAVPAGTVVLLRDSPAGLEALLVRRSSRLAFAGGMWVFPGGRVDPSDHGDPPEPDAGLAAARRAAVREAREEAGLLVAEDELVCFSNWTPPAKIPKRFATWFFVARAPATGDVTVDGVEIEDHCWMRPADAHRRRDAGEIELAPPTWITLAQLAEHDDVAGALGRARDQQPEFFATRVAFVDEVAVALYSGDAAYEGGDVEQPGPRHRLWMPAIGWRYERHA